LQLQLWPPFWGSTSRTCWLQTFSAWQRHLWRRLSQGTQLLPRASRAAWYSCSQPVQDRQVFLGYLHSWHLPVAQSVWYKVLLILLTCSGSVRQSRVLSLCLQWKGCTASCSRTMGTARVPGKLRDIVLKGVCRGVSNTGCYRRVEEKLLVDTSAVAQPR